MGTRGSLIGTGALAAVLVVAAFVGMFALWTVLDAIRAGLAG